MNRRLRRLKARVVAKSFFFFPERKILTYGEICDSLIAEET